MIILIAAVMFEVKRSQRSKEPKNVFPGDEDGDAEEEVLGFDVFTDRAPQTGPGDSEAVEDFGIVTAGLTSFAATQKEGETRKNPIFKGPVSGSGSVEPDTKTAWPGPVETADPTYLDIASVSPEEATTNMMLAPGYRHYFPAETGTVDSLDADLDMFAPKETPAPEPSPSPPPSPPRSPKQAEPASSPPVASHSEPPASSKPPAATIVSVESAADNDPPKRAAPPKRKIFNL